MVRLSDISLEGRVHGSIADQATGKFYEVFTRQMRNGNGIAKHMIFLRQGDFTVGYGYFVSDAKMSSIYGFQVNQEMRGTGLANALMELYLSLCDANGLTELRTEKQRKPITALLLTRFGYTPNSSAQRNDVQILAPTDSRVRIAFSDGLAKERFEASRLYRGGQYLIDEICESPLATVRILSKYSLTDRVSLEAKRETVRDRFVVSI